MKIVREASDLSIPVGVVPKTISLENKEWIFSKTLYESDEIIGWRYKIKYPTNLDYHDELDIIND